MTKPTMMPKFLQGSTNCPMLEGGAQEDLPPFVTVVVLEAGGQIIIAVDYSLTEHSTKRRANMAVRWTVIVSRSEWHEI